MSTHGSRTHKLGLVVAVVIVVVHDIIPKYVTPRIDTIGPSRMILPAGT